MNNSLEKFGEQYISEVRDRTISEIISLMNGTMKDEKSIVLKEKLKKLSPEAIEVIQLLVIHSIDLTLFNTLFMFENNPELFYLCDNNQNNLNTLSDGLSGELYSDEGWIKHYSKYK